MSIKHVVFVLCALIMPLAACGDDSDDGGAGASGSGDGDGDGDDCADAPTYDEVTALDKCTMCHSSDLSGPDRNNAPADHNFDTYDGVTAQLGHIEEEVEEGKMPPPGSGITISSAERAQLLKWIECGAEE
jgi:uncharacterized membrane protein